jgi:hypothetical protein
MAVITRKDMPGILVTFLLLAFFLSGEVWSEYREPIRIVFWVFLGVTVIVFLLSTVRNLRTPNNYRSLHIVSHGLEYENLARAKITIQWSDISSIYFVRDDALFEDIEGPYLETMWILKTEDGKSTDVMDEWQDRQRLMRAFKRNLPGFDMKLAKSAIKGKGRGRWECFSKTPNEALNPDAQSSAPVS